MSSPLAALPRPITILVVDDEPMIRKLCRRIFERAGYEVQEASDAPDAVAMLAGGGHFDVVVSDVRMPGDGHALAEYVGSGGPRTRFVFISGFGSHVAQLTVVGPLLTKPFTGAQLLETVRQVLARSA